MMIETRPRGGVLFATGLGIAAAVCGGTALAQAGTSSVAADAYRLVQVGSSTLPALVEQEGTCTEQVLSATLTLDAGKWLLETTDRESCGGMVDDETEREEGSYRTDGSAIFFGDADEDADDDAGSTIDIDLDDLGVGTISGDGITVTLEDGRTILHFAR